MFIKCKYFNSAFFFCTVQLPTRLNEIYLIPAPYRYSPLQSPSYSPCGRLWNVAKTFCLLFLGPKNIELKVFSVFDRFWSSLINPINCERKNIKSRKKR